MSFDVKVVGVLLVEDQMAMRKIIKTVLQAIGIKNIFEATDGSEALTILRNPIESRAHSTGHNTTYGRSQIDLIICDWAMPRMTGIELLQTLRADARYHSVPFVMLTAENTKEQIVRAVELGVTDYIVKPFTATTLEAKLRSILTDVLGLDVP